jgi:hypothetical protein
MEVTNPNFIPTQISISPKYIWTFIPVGYVLTYYASYYYHIPKLDLVYWWYNTNVDTIAHINYFVVGYLKFGNQCHICKVTTSVGWYLVLQFLCLIITILLPLLHFRFFRGPLNGPRRIGIGEPKSIYYLPIPSYLHMDQVHAFASRTCRAAQHDITHNHSCMLNYTLLVG